MKREVVKSVVWALIVTVLLGVAIVVGSRNLSRFDSALVAYTFASLFAAFGLTYRYAMWLQRPPTALYWRRGDLPWCVPWLVKLVRRLDWTRLHEP